MAQTPQRLHAHRMRVRGESLVQGSGSAKRGLCPVTVPVSAALHARPAARGSYTLQTLSMVRLVLRALYLGWVSSPTPA